MTECPWFFDDDDDYREFREKAGALPEGNVATGYFRFDKDEEEGATPADAPNPIAVLVSELLKRLGWEDQDLRPIADYFRIAGIRASGIMAPRIFGLDVLSEEVQERLKHERPSSGLKYFWDPWYGMIGGPT